MPASRPLVLTLFLLASLAPQAAATEQIEERLIHDGRVYHTSVTPLEPFIKKLGPNPFQAEAVSSNLWRGYVGTWRLTGDTLYLVALHRYGYNTTDAGVSTRIRRDIPLTTLFGDTVGPVHAKWYSGQLLVPRGRMLRTGFRSRDSLSEKTLYLTLKDGRVTSRRLVDNKAEGRALSADDIQWVMRAAAPPVDDGAWVDARRVPQTGFQETVPTGTRFRTRGVLSTWRPEDASLWIPRTPSTEHLRIRVRGVEKLSLPTTMSHVELYASWEREGRDTILRVESVRALEPGETIHHPRFDPPENPAATPGLPRIEPGKPYGHEVKTSEYLDVLFGQLVTLRGPLRPGLVPTIHGVEVAASGAPEGIEPAGDRPASASGLLQMWNVTRELLARDPEVRRVFGARGPGTWYRLVDPETGALAAPAVAAPPAIARVSTWAELYAQERIELPDGGWIRLGLQRTAAPLRSGSLLYCLVGGSETRRTSHVLRNGARALGPAIFRTHSKGGTVVLGAAMLEDVPPLGAEVKEALYAGMICVSSLEVLHIEVSLPDGRLLATGRLIPTRGLSHPWMPLRRPQASPGGTSKTDASPAATLTPRSTSWAVPDVSGLRPLVTRKQAAPPPTGALPTLDPTSPDPTLKLETSKDGFVLTSTLPLRANWIEDRLLYRLWVNDHPLTRPSEQSEQAREWSGPDLRAKKLVIKVDWELARHGVKPGDKVTLQVLWCPAGWRDGEGLASLSVELPDGSPLPRMTRRRPLTRH